MPQLSLLECPGPGKVATPNEKQSIAASARLSAHAAVAAVRVVVAWILKITPSVFRQRPGKGSHRAGPAVGSQRGCGAGWNASSDNVEPTRMPARSSQKP